MTKLLFLSLEKRFSKIYSSFSCVTFRVLEKNVLFGFPPPSFLPQKIHPLLEEALRESVLEKAALLFDIGWRTLEC